MQAEKKYFEKKSSIINTLTVSQTGIHSNLNNVITATNKTPHTSNNFFLRNHNTIFLNTHTLSEWRANEKKINQNF